MGHDQSYQDLQLYDDVNLVGVCEVNTGQSTVELYQSYHNLWLCDFVNLVGIGGVVDTRLSTYGLVQSC